MARALNFTKGHGTGNDFVLYADPLTADSGANCGPV
jgi:diaminopimelate epimerase